jgi:hypothetical protein
VSCSLLVSCGAPDESEEETEPAAQELLTCGEVVVAGIGYPVGDKTTYPAGGWQVWQVLSHYWSAYGGRHLAHDISVSGGYGAINAPVYSMAGGTVLYAKANGSTYKNVILIRHPQENGQYVCSFYAHVNTPWVSAGQTVARGQQIATVMDWAFAAGGASSNTHLHYVLLDKAYCDYAASTGTANWSGSGVCGYDHGGSHGVSDLSNEPASYTAVSDNCGAWQFASGLLSPTKYVEAQKQAATQCSNGGKPNWSPCASDGECQSNWCGCNGGPIPKVCLPNTNYPKTCQGGSDPCVNANAGNGLYCGGSLGAGDSHTLYNCQNGVTASQQVCANGCQMNPPGTPDACVSGGGSCVAKCGMPSSGCWCDAACTSYGDCCPDKVAVCGS